MEDTEALITAARNYCSQNISYWNKKYINERTGNDFLYAYTDNDYNLFPRYNMLNALLEDVETLVGQTFPIYDICQKEIKNLALTSENIFTSGEDNSIAKAAMEDERSKFVAFIENLTHRDLNHVTPLPFRRRLKEWESIQIRKNLLNKWGYDSGYWDPLENKSMQPTVFIMKDNLSKEDHKKITKFLRSISSPKLLLIGEDRIDYEIEIDTFDLNLYETICCDRTYNWIIYGSHESTITLGGEILIGHVEQLFLNRKDKLNKWETNY